MDCVVSGNEIALIGNASPALTILTLSSHSRSKTDLGPDSDTEMNKEMNAEMNTMANKNATMLHFINFDQVADLDKICTKNVQHDIK